jgi:hypothetical protein
LVRVPDFILNSKNLKHGEVMGFRSAKRGYSLRDKNAGVNNVGSIVAPVVAALTGALGLGDTAKLPPVARRNRYEYLGEKEEPHFHKRFNQKKGEPPKVVMVTVKRYTELPQGRNWPGEGSGAPARRMRQAEKLAAKNANGSQ